MEGKDDPWADIDQCRLEAMKYRTKADFRAGSPAAYRAVVEADLIDHVCAHMGKTAKPASSAVFWTFQEVKDTAMRYQTLRAFRKGPHRRAYLAAKRNGWLTDVCAHMLTLETVANPWDDIERCRSESCKFTNKKAFKELSPEAFKASVRNGWLDEVCAHMVLMDPKVWEQLSLEDCRREALKYSSRVAFSKGHKRAYETARRNGWLDEVCSHIVPSHLPMGYWTYERCKESALKYDTRKEFLKGCGGGYDAAKRNNWLDTLCSHMRTAKK